MAAFDNEEVLDVHHWTDTLFSFRTTRSPSLRFDNGQFAMIGLEVDGRPLLRAYSFASPNYEDHLEFYSIKVPDGALTSRLQHIKPGDRVLVGHKPTGTLVQSSLTPGKRLFLLSTGTGIAPFASILRDLDIYDAYETIVLMHGCRETPELAYGQKLVRDLLESEYFGEPAREKLVYYPMTTRSESRHQGRVTDALENGKFFADTNQPPLDPATDRAMICGNPDMLAQLRTMFDARGFAEGSNARPGAYVFERAFVDK
jgi:ferredoxin--NADP+ reductase